MLHSEPWRSASKPTCFRAVKANVTFESVAQFQNSQSCEQESELTKVARILANDMLLKKPPHSEHETKPTGYLLLIDMFHRWHFEPVNPIP